MNKTAKFFAQKRTQSSSTPISRSSKKMIKQELSIEEIYNEVKHKMSEMELAFKSEHMGREREMLKTYVKVLDKIGAEVLTAKQKYLNLDKENLKTDKRLQFVTQLNKEREQCNTLTQNIKSVKEEIKRYEDENNYLEKEVEALQKIAHRKRSLSKSEHQKYRNSKQKAKSLQKRWSCSLKQNEKFMTIPKATAENKDHFDIKNRTKSYMINSQEPQMYADTENSEVKKNERPQTQQKYIGNRRKKNIYFNAPLQENSEPSQLN